MVLFWGENQLWFSEKACERAYLRQWESESLYEVADYIRHHYAEAVSLTALSRLACMSRNKLAHAFKQAHGVTVTEYIQAVRMEKAKDLLLNSQWEMWRIAGSIGYKLHRSFSEAFKEATGFTPSEYRKQNSLG